MEEQTEMTQATLTDRVTRMAIEARVKSIEHGFLLSDEHLILQENRGFNSDLSTQKRGT